MLCVFFKSDKFSGPSVPTVTGVVFMRSFILFLKQCVYLFLDFQTPVLNPI